MADRGQDRRVKRTRGQLKVALLELIGERSYDAISIQDITERADVGRSTFYSHFASKEELLFDGFDKWLLSLTEREHGTDSIRAEDGRADGFRFSLPFLRHIRGQRHFFKTTIAPSGSRRVRKRTLELLASMIRRELDRMGAQWTDERVAEAHVRMLAGAYLGLVEWWLDQSPRLEAEAVDRVFQELAVSPLPRDRRP